MGRGRDFRGGGSGRGRPARDEDQSSLDLTLPNLSARTPSAGATATVEAIVNWFNPEKGFGFVEIADGSGDAFLPSKALQAAGRTVSPGAKLSVFVGPGEKGRQVTKIVAIGERGKNAQAPASSRIKPPEADLSDAKQGLGTVKWFSVEKGMGFVAAEDGGKDVFVHISVVKQAHMAGLSEGQRISMRVIETLKGRQAVSIAAVD